MKLPIFKVLTKIVIYRSFIFNLLAKARLAHFFLHYMYMSTIKLQERLKKASRQDKRDFINSDETWAFTEEPKKEIPENDKTQITPHDLFNLFTADIIRSKTLFIR